MALYRSPDNDWLLYKMEGQENKRTACKPRIVVPSLIISIVCFLVVLVPTLVLLLVKIRFNTLSSSDETTQSQNGNYTSYNNDTESQSSATENISVTAFIVCVTVSALPALAISISMYYLIYRLRGRKTRHHVVNARCLCDEDYNRLHVFADNDDDSSMIGKRTTDSGVECDSDIHVTIYSQEEREACPHDPFITHVKSPTVAFITESEPKPKYTEVKIQRVIPLGALDQTLDITKPCQDPSNSNQTSSQHEDTSSSCVINHKISTQGTPEYSVSNEITVKHTKPSEAACVLEQDVSEPRFDWNQLFIFMTAQLSQDWNFFFLDLFGHCQHLLPRGIDSNSIIEQKQSDMNGKTTKTLLFELFIEWRKVMGDEASPSLIKTSLQKTGLNLALKNFQEFMSDLPLLQEKRSHSISSTETEVLKPFLPIANQQKVHIMALHDRKYSYTNDTFPLRSHEASRLEIRWMSNDDPDVHDRDNLPGTSGSANNRRVLHRESKVSYVSPKGKRLRSEYDTSSPDNEDAMPFKKRKYDTIPATPFRNKSVKRKQQRAMSADKCHELIQWKNIDMDFIIELIVKLFQSDSTVLEANHYYLFLHHTVSLLMKKTSYPEETILSVLVEDYEKVAPQKSNRGHVFYMLDTPDETLPLGTKEWDCLKMYAEKARTRIIARQMQIDVEFVASKYLFIDYDGQLLAKQESVDISTTPREGEKVTEQKIMAGVQTGEEDVKESETHGFKSAASHPNITPLNPVVGTSNMSKEDVLSKQESVDVSMTMKEGKKFAEPKIIEGGQTGEEDVKETEAHVDKSEAPHLCTNKTPLNPAIEISNMLKEDVLSKQENVDVSTTTKEVEKFAQQKLTEGVQTGGEDVKESESHVDKSGAPPLCTNITPVNPVVGTSSMSNKDVLSKQENVDISTTPREGEKVTEPKLIEGVQRGEKDVKESESHVDKFEASHLCTNITPLSPVVGTSNISNEDVISEQENEDVPTITKEGGTFAEREIIGGVQTCEEDVKKSESHVNKSATPHLCTNISPLNPAIGTTNMLKEDVLAKQDSVDVSTTTKKGEKFTEPEIMEGVQTCEEDVKESESHVDKSATPHLCTNISPLNPAIGTSNMLKEDVLSKQENADVLMKTNEGEKFTEPEIMEGVQAGEEDVKESSLQHHIYAQI